jgi:MFS family permease
MREVKQEPQLMLEMGASRPAAQSSNKPSLVLHHGSTSVSNPPSQPPTQLVPYTTFSLRYRWYLTILLGYLCLASSLTANIYFPLLTLLAKDYSTTIQAINLTITLYVAIQGVAPSIFSPLSDSLGRRPVYLMSFSLYAIASLGLAFSGSSYVALLLLRAMQSMGGSATLSLAYAVVADYTVHAERGRFLSPMMTATNIGPR